MLSERRSVLRHGWGGDIKARAAELTRRRKEDDEMRSTPEPRKYSLDRTYAH